MRSLSTKHQNLITAFEQQKETHEQTIQKLKAQNEEAIRNEIAERDRKTMEMQQEAVRCR